MTLLFFQGVVFSFIVFDQPIDQGLRQEFSDRGLTLPTRGLKYGLQGIVNAKNLRQNTFSPSDGGPACSDRGTIVPSSPPGATPAIDVLLSICSRTSQI